MSISIVYSSRTGNTRLLAETIRQALEGQELVYFGEPGKEALEADRLYVGFWTDKGSCSDDVRDFLKQIHGKEVFLFGTAGFGGAPGYYEKILRAVQKHLDRSVTVVGTYMCQGKMPMAVRERYEKMLENPIHMPNLKGMIENFDRALSHPDAADLEALKARL